MTDELLEDEANSPTEPRPRDVPFWVYVLFTVIVVGGAWMAIQYLNGAEVKLIRGASANIMMHPLGLTFQFYANEDPNGAYPPCAPYEDLWVFDVEAMYPEYLSDLSLLVSPALPNGEALQAELEAMKRSGTFDWERVARIAAESYVYLGWAVADPAEIPELMALRGPAGTFDSDLVSADGKIHRLADDAGRHFVEDGDFYVYAIKASSNIPVLYESNAIAQRFEPFGANVMYLDGHVEFHRDSPEVFDFSGIESAMRR